MLLAPPQRVVVAPACTVGRAAPAPVIRGSRLSTAAPRLDGGTASAAELLLLHELGPQSRHVTPCPYAAIDDRHPAQELLSWLLAGWLIVLEKNVTSLS